MREAQGVGEIKTKEQALAFTEKVLRAEISK
jgi:hypothetical protein